jgi:hypothetical protein
MMIMIALILSSLLLARPHYRPPQFRQLNHPCPGTQDAQEFDDHITSRSPNRIPEILNSSLTMASTEALAIPQANLSTAASAAPTTFRIIPAAAVTTLLLLLLVASCGGGNSAAQPSGTPVGTYTLTLTASSPSNPSPPPTLELALTIQ